MTEPNANHVVNRSRFALGVVVTLLIGIFAFAIPLAAYICQGFVLVYDYEAPRASQLIITASPWLPLLIAIIGCVILLAKESRISASAALKWNRAAILFVVLIGGFSLFECVIPIATLIFSMNEMAWW
jgi:hypothetical protein